MGLVAVDINFPATVVAQIKQMGVRAAKHAVEEMRDGADEIVEHAKDFAPYDKGCLQAAIERNPNEERDRTMSGRKIVAVWVNPDMRGSGGVGGETVGLYAARMHEQLAPFGSGEYHARSGTTGKGPEAGGKFLERAINLVKTRMTDRIVGLLRRQKLL